MNIRTLFIILIISVQLGFGQQSNLDGEILDKSNKSPLLFANIILEGTTFGAASDSEGKFSIQNIDVGTYTLIATYMGYSTFKTTIEIPYKESYLTILLEPEAIQMEEYVVTASRRRERIEDAPAAISVISKKEIRRESNTNLGDYLK